MSVHFSWGMILKDCKRTHPHCPGGVRGIADEYIRFGAAVQLVDKPGVDSAECQGAVFVSLLDGIDVLQ